MSEINVTPFVDIMLVLLIIFMVAAPLLSVGIEVDLPSTQAKPLETEKERPLTLTLDGESNLFINCLLYTSPSPRDTRRSRMPSSA